ncbi:MAG TPA: O-antigen ligase family protein [Bacteroidales bacterium]|nr:O-antigen ligase family protein [Bacteroidales bacterium]HPS26219.1 O-antigen ligase family protein [Bacteroidales bacterium]
MSNKSKLIWVYVISAIFIALNIYFIIKEFYWFSLIPIVLILVLLFFFALDKVLYIITFCTPLAINLRDFDDRLSLSLPTEPLLFGALIFFFIKLIFERQYDIKVLKHPVTIAIIINLLWMFITALTSELPLVSFKFLISRLWFVVPFYFVAIILFKNMNNIRIITWMYAIPLVIVIIYSTYRLFIWSFDEQAAHWVMDPFYNDHTAYGAAIALFIPVFAAFLLDKHYNRTMKLFAGMVLFFLIVGLLCSFSRAAWISVLAALVIAGLVFLKIKFRWIFLTGIIILAVFLYYQNDILMKLEKNKQDSSANLVEHVQSISNISSDASNLERINRWQSALKMFKERPVLGWGPGTYQFVYAPFQQTKDKTIISTNAGDKGTAHSEYIGPLSESGFLGMLSILAIVIVISITAIRVYKQAKNPETKILALSYFLGLVTYFIHGTLNNFLDTDKSSVPFWTFAAAIVAIDVFHHRQANSPNTGTVSQL